MKFATYPLVGAASLALLLSACGSDDSDPGSGDGTEGGSDNGGTSTGEAGADLELINDGTLTVCSDIPYPPFEMEDSSTETGYTGFDIDIVSAIAEGLELDLQVKDSSFDALQSGLALNSGDCDLAASAMTITEERQENLAFSDGYYDSQQSLLVPADSDIESIDDLAGRTVGVQQGTTGEAYTEENAPEARITSFPSDAEMFQAIQAGQVDALLQDLPVNLEHTREADYEIVEEYSTDETYGFAMKKGNDALVEAVNEQLAELRDSGEYDEIYDRYFSTEDSGDDAGSTTDG